MAKWRFFGRIVGDGEPIALRGLNPWRLDWVSLPEAALVVPHPTYPEQRHELSIFEISDGAATVKFAAGELSYGAWCFYLLDE